MNAMLHASPNYLYCHTPISWLVCSSPSILFIWGNFFTLDKLQKRGFSLANRCCFLSKNEETTNHIVLSCEATRVLWNLLISLWHPLG